MNEQATTCLNVTLYSLITYTSGTHISIIGTGKKQQCIMLEKDLKCSQSRVGAYLVDNVERHSNIKRSSPFPPFRRGAHRKPGNHFSLFLLVVFLFRSAISFVLSVLSFGVLRFFPFFSFSFSPGGLLVVAVAAAT